MRVSAMRPGLAIVVALGLAGCAVQQVPGVQPVLPDTCGAGARVGLVGQPARVLATTKFDGPVRMIRPGDLVTEDFSPDRLNIDIDLKETIRGVRCG